MYLQEPPRGDGASSSVPPTFSLLLVCEYTSEHTVREACKRQELTKELYLQNPEGKILKHNQQCLKTHNAQSKNIIKQ